MNYDIYKLSNFKCLLFINQHIYFTKANKQLLTVATLVISNKHDMNQGILYLTFLKNSMDVEIDIKQLADY